MKNYINSIKPVIGMKHMAAILALYTYFGYKYISIPRKVRSGGGLALIY